MKDSKLIKILKTFSPEEIKSFEKFITSPYFNTVKNYLFFFKELIKFYPDFNDDRLNGELIYRKLYKGKPFNKQVMWNLNSKLEDLANEFLEQVALGKNKFERLELLVSEIGNRKLLNNYSHTLKEMEELLEKKQEQLQERQKKMEEQFEKWQEKLKGRMEKLKERFDD